MTRHSSQSHFRIHQKLGKFAQIDGWERDERSFSGVTPIHLFLINRFLCFKSLNIVQRRTPLRRFGGSEMSLATWMTALGESEESEEFVSVHGARMRCLVAGKGPAVLLLHGLLGTADAWGPATQRLAASSKVFAPDALGIGGSDRVPKLDVSLSATVGRLSELMDAKGIDQADIVGTSHGGSV